MRNVTVALDRLLDAVVAIPVDGIDPVHWFLGEAVGHLDDRDLAQYVQSLVADGQDRRERDAVDATLRIWRKRYCQGARRPATIEQVFREIAGPTEPPKPQEKAVVSTTTSWNSGDAGDGYET